MKSIEATMSVLKQIDVDEIKLEKEELPQLNYSKDIPQLKQLFDCNIDDEIQFLAAVYKTPETKVAKICTSDALVDDTGYLNYYNINGAIQSITAYVKRYHIYIDCDCNTNFFLHDNYT